VVRLTTEVLEAVARDGITDGECRIAKGSLRGALVLGLEDSASRMNRLGRGELNYGEYRTISDTLQRIDDVTVDEVNLVARKVLSGHFGAAVLGPYRTERSLPRGLRAIAG
jgi:predicted Zn-dependent peptidase